MRPSYPPVTGTCRYFRDENGNEWIRINGKWYGMERLPGVFRLYSAPNVSYDVSIGDGDQPRCTCWDYTARDRPGGCKHVRSLRAEGFVAEAR